MKPLTTTRLAWNNLGRKPLRTFGLAFVVALFSFTMSGGALLSESVGKGLVSLRDRLGADILVVPHGYDKKLQAALLRGEPSTFYIKGDLTAKVRDIPGVTRAAPQLYLATLNASCCTLPIQLIAYDPETDFVIKPWTAASLDREPADDEIVVGSSIVGEIGNVLSLFGRNYKIAARLQRTGMGFDTTVFMTMRTARALLRTVEEGAVGNYTPGAVSSIMLGVSPGVDLKDMANSILQKFALDYNLDIVVSKNMISDIAQKIGNMSILVHILSAVFWLAATGILFIFFTLLLNERQREFGLLRILGATRKKLVGIVLVEALLVGLLGGGLGIIAALGLTLPFHRLVTMTMGLPYMAVSVPYVAALAGGCLVLSVATGLAASIYSAMKISSSETYLTLRRGE